MIDSGTIRTKLLRIGGRIRVTARRIVLSLSEGYPYQELFWCVLHNLRQDHPLPLTG